ncbi:QsdR family transcriptional regulator [Cellulomonas sp. S1-8]|uniref:QsdR family transcriptional regulator n=1 Tax=Cellulomonas sp. S1-8 TaxID=2904790 RepID=UPI002242E47F|nr:QsdR family transcriptional regulator [Cellulomonas sp. S1-8]UZN03039.1 QsdR family transcriptional regulator [Cellulomonas sp. S1-8]
MRQNVLEPSHAHLIHLAYRHHRHSRIARGRSGEDRETAVADDREPSAPVSTVRVLSHATAVHGGIRHFLSRGMLDMNMLARELAVSRATLYRTVRSRDALLGDVLISLGRRSVDLALAERYPAGVDGVIEVSRRFARRLQDAEALRWFAQQEPEAAHRILLAPHGCVHARAVDVQRELFVRIGGPEICGREPTPSSPHGSASGLTDRRLPRSLEAPVPRVPVAQGDPLADRAFLYIRVLESVLYGPMLAGRRPDFALAEPALRALLR